MRSPSLKYGAYPIFGLRASNPFPGQPPKWIRAELYQYTFTAPGEPGGHWWRRTRVGQYLPPLSLDNREFQLLLRTQGWQE